ncbi:hypothetical protein C8Q74DRAFT_1374239 [Fomes fomentarius]|nr:hypothetical protein C8Q74DRAFT_1374239 [Fomes fomentarius]
MTRWFTERACEELAERVRAIPGGQHYTAAHVYRYFASLRSRLKRHGAAGPSQIDTQVPSKVAMLEVLLKDDPNPSPEPVAEIWAERLGGGVTVEQVTHNGKETILQPKVGRLSLSNLRLQPHPIPPPFPTSPEDLLMTQTFPESRKSLNHPKSCQCRKTPHSCRQALGSADELESTVIVDPLELAMRLHSALSSTYRTADSSTPRGPRSLAELARWLGEQQNMTMEL